MALLIGAFVVAAGVFAWHLSRVKREDQVKIAVEGGFVPYYYAKFGKLPIDLTGFRDFLSNDHAYQTLSFVKLADPELSDTSTNGAHYQATLKFHWLLGGVYHISLDKAVIRSNAEHYSRAMAQNGNRR